MGFMSGSQSTDPIQGLLVLVALLFNDGGDRFELLGIDGFVEDAKSLQALLCRDCSEVLVANNVKEKEKC